MNAHPDFPDRAPVPACPICAGHATPWLIKSAYRLVRCASCGHGYLANPLPRDHVARQYDDDYFFGGGDGYADYTASGDLLRAQGRYHASLIARHAPPGRMIDIGAAAGFVLKGFEDAGWQGIGIEPNATMRVYGRKMLDVNLISGDAESFSAGDPVDLVTMIQVIGHLHDLHAALRNLSFALKPGGLCLVDYWDRTSLPARMLGAGWHEISPPSVVHWFGPDDLAAAFARHGLHQLDSGRPRKIVLGRHVASLLHHKLSESRLLAPIAGLTKLIPPGLRIPYPPLDLKWALFRKEAA
ncbi:MAG: class I SAM-dependent methyltransferase [Rhodobiaceae bacterium]|nr:class I SAM-dependent methyltransferase [Rhodobiaceae bacterium]MCC0014342.1 class I SAM-dependent methyltransferase [Rhodobiaceae bacterium]MCC0050782.1 class I SAM-dependent methyltransferase [Rhodobiaceae bacterium]MCC0060574.1 class I SAM-dependent methyltransferase [Rhodobiaceae bacterium]